MSSGKISSTSDRGISQYSGNITITGGEVSGAWGIGAGNQTSTGSSGSVTIGINDGGTPSTTSPRIYGKNIGISNANYYSELNFYDGKVELNQNSVSLFTPIHPKMSTIKTPVGYDILLSDDGTTYTLVKFAYVNKPELPTGMIPIKFDTNGTARDTTLDDKDWYAYIDQGTYKDDKRTSRWANARTQDGSQWVWIPRFAYKIVRQPSYSGSGENAKTTEGGEIDVIFLKGTGKTYIDTDGQEKNIPSDYIVHPAFANESNTSPKFKSGGWDKELTGIWVAKYKASQGTETESISGQKYPKFMPNFNIYYTKIGDSFTLCKNLATNNSNPYNFNSSTIDTHLIKNSEWGAVAYLTQSKYGRNGVDVQPNKAGVITGYGSSKSDAYNTQNGQKASTTGNIYGIYDMSGGAFEYTAGYLKNGNSNLTTYGKSLLTETSTTNGKNGTSTKYVSVYNVGSSDMNTNNYNESTNSARKGEAIWETSKIGSKYTSWFGEYSHFMTEVDSFFYRGGNYLDSSIYDGLFCFAGSEGNRSGFRAVCIPK